MQNNRSAHTKMCMLALTLSLAAMPFSVANGAEKVRVAGLTWPGYGWWQIAKEKKLAPDLDISYQAIEDPFQSFTLMTSGQLEMVSSTAEFGPIGASQKMPVRMFAFGNLSHGTDRIIVQRDISAAADLKGKKVAVMVGGLPQIFMGIYLEKNGVPFNSVEYVNVIMDQAAAAMIGKTVGGAELWEPFGKQTLANVPGSKVVADTRDESWAKDALVADAHYINSDWAKAHHGTALKAVRAMYDAIAWWKKYPTEGNKIIARGMKMSVPDVELVLGKNGTGLDGGLYPYTFLEAARFCGSAPGNPPFEQENGQMINHFKLVNEWWLKFGLVKATYSPEAGTDCSFLKELYEGGYRG